MTLIVVLTSRWIGKRLINDTTFSVNVQHALWLVLIAMVISIVTAQFLMRVYPMTEPSLPLQIFHWFALSSMATLAMLAVFTAVRDLALIPFTAEKRALLKNSFSLGAMGLTGIGTLGGLIQARVLPRIKRVTVTLDNLPEAHHGLTIAQLTDVHIGPTIRGDHLQKIVELTNELKPDIIAMTGDLVDGLVPQMAAQVEPFKNLQSRYGTFYITGNHEYYWGAQDWVTHFMTLGFQPLQNTHRALNINGEKLVIAGVNDVQAEQMGAEGPDMKKAFKDAPTGTTRILLAHHPKLWDTSHEHGVHLQISGHTHAGQFWPVTWVVLLVHKYVKGLFERTNAQGQQEFLYVSPATGYWGPPNRLFNPAEITHITLLKKGRPV